MGSERAWSGTSWTIVDVTPDRRRLKFGAMTVISDGSGNGIGSGEVIRDQRPDDVLSRQFPPSRLAIDGFDQARRQFHGDRCRRLIDPASLGPIDDAVERAAVVENPVDFRRVHRSGPRCLVPVARR